MWPAQEAGSEKDKPTVVAGDFNTPRPQLPEPQKLSKDEDREMAPHPATGSDGHKQRPPRFFKRPGNGAKISHIRGRTIHLHGLLKTEAIRNASSDCNYQNSDPGHKDDRQEDDLYTLGTQTAPS